MLVRPHSRFFLLRLGKHHRGYHVRFAPTYSAHRSQPGRCLSGSAITLSSAPPAPRTPSPFKASNNDLAEADGHEQTQADFRHGLETVTSFYGRFIKYSALSLGTLLGLVYVGWEGAHQWVEWVELRRPSSLGDGDVFEWADESFDTKWTGGAAGGTDPRLGYRGRHAVRAAWMSLNWGVSDDVRMTAVEASEGRNAYDKQLEDVLRHLSVALGIADANAITVSGRPVIVDLTIADLLTQTAAVFERISSTSALQAAKQVLQQVYDYHDAQGPSHDTATARLSLKLGDVCSRLGENVEALAWWRGALNRLGIDEDHLAQSQNPVALSQTVSPSPARQRLIASALLSLSAHYASTQQYEAAQVIEKKSIPLILGFQMISRFPTFTPSGQWAVAGRLDSNSAGAIMHYLSLRYRSAILSMHQAEVVFAANIAPSSSVSTSPSSTQSPESAHATPDAQSIETSLGLLRIASGAAENICLRLTSLRLEGIEQLDVDLQVLAEAVEQIAARVKATSATPTLPNPSPPVTSAIVNPAFTPLENEARALLRQSKRAAAQALLLQGILLEKWAAQTGDLQGDAEALEQYERALLWAGGGPDGCLTCNDAIESEWKAIWDHYVRVREKVSKGDCERD